MLYVIEYVVFLESRSVIEGGSLGCVRMNLECIMYRRKVEWVFKERDG